LFGNPRVITNRIKNFGIEFGTSEMKENLHRLSAIPFTPKRNKMMMLRQKKVFRKFIWDFLPFFSAKIQSVHFLMQDTYHLPFVEAKESDRSHEKYPLLTYL
jgi:hypothetical protein